MRGLGDRGLYWHFAPAYLQHNITRRDSPCKKSGVRPNVRTSLIQVVHDGDVPRTVLVVDMPHPDLRRGTSSEG